MKGTASTAERARKKQAEQPAEVNLPVSRTVGPRLVAHWNVPVELAGPGRDAVFVYLSLEHPFRASAQ
jgi:hypothetical protein